MITLEEYAKMKFQSFLSWIIIYQIAFPPGAYPGKKFQSFLSWIIIYQFNIFFILYSSSLLFQSFLSWIIIYQPGFRLTCKVGRKFQSFLSWIIIYQNKGVVSNEKNNNVSILLILDNNLSASQQFSLSSSSSMFQSFLSWIKSISSVKTYAKPHQKFQSFLSWIIIYQKTIGGRIMRNENVSILLILDNNLSDGAWL